MCISSFDVENLMHLKLRKWFRKTDGKTKQCLFSTPCNIIYYYQYNCQVVLAASSKRFHLFQTSIECLFSNRTFVTCTHIPTNTRTATHTHTHTHTHTRTLILFQEWFHGFSLSWTLTGYAHYIWHVLVE